MGARKLPSAGCDMVKVVYNDCYGGFSLSNEALDWLLERGSKGVELYEEVILGIKGTWRGPRHDPLLIECIETLGEKANGRFGKLEIHELNGPKYIIDEYDGMEYVQEPGDIEWIDIREEWRGDEEDGED
jgi:hypothetical protein